MLARVVTSIMMATLADFTIIALTFLPSLSLGSYYGHTPLTSSNDPYPEQGSAATVTVEGQSEQTIGRSPALYPHHPRLPWAASPHSHPPNSDAGYNVVTVNVMEVVTTTSVTTVTRTHVTTPPATEGDGRHRQTTTRTLLAPTFTVLSSTTTTTTVWVSCRLTTTLCYTRYHTTTTPTTTWISPHLVTVTSTVRKDCQGPPTRKDWFDW